MNDDKELFRLIANPLKINRKKIKIESHIDKELFNLLKRKYPEYIIESSDIETIYDNLQNTLKELTHINLINNFINNIIEDVIQNS